MPECTEDRAKRLANQARRRARVVAQRIRTTAAANTVIDTGQAQSGWRMKRSGFGFKAWEVYHSMNFNSPEHERNSKASSALASAVSKHMPVTHVDDSGSGLSVVVKPWTWQEIFAAGCKPRKGSSVFVPAAPPAARPRPEPVPV